MKIKREIIEAINNVKNRRVLAEVLDTGDQTVYTHLRNNADDGILTKFIALRAISRITGLPIEQLVTESNAEQIV